MLFHLIVRIRLKSVCSVVMCAFTQGFLHCGFFLAVKQNLYSQMRFTRFIVDWLIVRVDVEQQWRQNTAMNQVILWFLHLLLSLISSTYNIQLDSRFWKNIHSVLSCVVELLDEDYMIHCIVTCRHIDKGGSCDHAPLVVIFYGLNEGYSELVHDFTRLKPVYSLMRCPSTSVHT